MGWLDNLRGELVGLDTPPFVYYIEQHPRYLHLVDPFFSALDQGHLRGITSTITVVELLVQPLRQGNIQLADRYRRAVSRSRNLVVRPVTTAVAEEAARLRAHYHLRTPDALQVAVALLDGARFFLTNDARLRSIPDLEVLVLDRLQ